MPLPKIEGQEQLESICGELKYLLPKEKPHIARHSHSFLQSCTSIKAVIDEHKQRKWNKRGTQRAIIELSSAVKTMKKLSSQLNSLSGDAYETLIDRRPTGFDEALQDFIGVVELAVKRLNSGPLTKSPKGRKKLYETQVAEEAGRLYKALTGKEPRRAISPTGNPHGHFYKFVSGIFGILEIKSSAAYQIRTAQLRAPAKATK